jgi:putative ABC transport system ATP-binding protein
MVFQRPVLFPGTVRDNLAAADPTATEAVMVETLRSADLDSSFLDRVADDLSGGEGQRVCLARTLMCRPAVLLMDEPTASLHPAAARTLEETTRTLQQEHNVDVVWVTHDLGQIARLAQHLIVLAEGRVAYAGSAGGPGAGAALASLSQGTG